MKQPEILFIDHRDSFSANLAAAFSALGAGVRILHYDTLKHLGVSSLNLKEYTGVVFSPGPGHPSEYKASAELLLNLPPNVPFCGVCLGHQLLLHAYHQKITPLPFQPAHGRRNTLVGRQSKHLTGYTYTGTFVFYNSLACITLERPDTDFQVMAEAEGCIAAIEHTALPRIGVQFHPESFASPQGSVFINAVHLWFLKHCADRGTPQSFG